MACVYLPAPLCQEQLSFGRCGVSVSVVTTAWWIFVANYTVQFCGGQFLLWVKLCRYTILYHHVGVCTIRYLYIGGYYHAASPAWPARFSQQPMDFLPVSLSYPMWWVNQHRNTYLQEWSMLAKPWQKRRGSGWREDRERYLLCRRPMWSAWVTCRSMIMRSLLVREISHRRLAGEEKRGP